jgi:hypothetical protein
MTIFQTLLNETIGLTLMDFTLEYKQIVPGLGN